MKRIFLWLVPGLIILLLGSFLSMSYGSARTYLDAQNAASVRRASSAENAVMDAGRFFVVERVIDGDTVDIIEGTETVRVRLIGINTPETVDPRTTVQCFGKEASKKTEELLVGGLVRLEDDPTQGTYDKYQRRLAYLFTPDGMFVNLELVRQGYAYEYTYRAPYKYQAEFQAAQKEAREQERGLWAPAACPE